MSRLHVYILIDRSGSMTSRWNETINAVNEYALELIKDTKAKINVALFDSPGAKLDYLLLRNKKKWVPLRADEASPRGMTPLFDAIGRTLNIAEKHDKKKSVLVVVTDGAENASKEFTKETIKKRLDKFEESGKQVVFIGADFNAFDQAASVGRTMAQTINVMQGNYGDSMRTIATKSKAYMSTNANINFDDSDRTEATKQQP